MKEQTEILELVREISGKAKSLKAVGMTVSISLYDRGNYSVTFTQGDLQKDEKQKTS